MLIIPWGVEAHGTPEFTPCTHGPASKPSRERNAERQNGGEQQKKPTQQQRLKTSCIAFLHEGNYLNWHKINLRSIFLELHRKIPRMLWQQLNISLIEFIWGLE